MKWRSQLAVILVTFAPVLAACTLQLSPAGGPYPGACSQFGIAERQCAAIVARAMDEAGVTRDQVAGIDLMPLPSQGPHLGGGIVAVVGLHLAGGRLERREISCPGISGAFDPACGMSARIRFGSGVDMDIPCKGADEGEGPAGCATLPPAPAPDLVAAARPFELAAIDIVIDHAGHYEIRLGAATLPAGYLTERSLTIMNDQPTSFWIPVGRLVVRSDLAGREPAGSRYREPYDGLEPVTVVLEFDVTRFIGPGQLQIRDIVVR